MRAAVVVGCDGYGTANASLAGAVRDALAFWHWVCDPNGGGVTDDSARRLLLAPSDKGVAVPAGIVAGPADKASFEIALHEVVRDAGDTRERLYVYFAGHGFSVDDDFTVQGAIAFADFDRNRTDNSIVVTELLSELSFSGFAEQILVFDACRNIPFEGRLRAGRISRPFDRVPGVTEQFCALATTALNRTSDGSGATAEEATFSGCLMRALTGEGAAKVWNEDANEYVVRWDQMFEFVATELRPTVGDDRVPRQLGERDIGDPVLARFPADAFADVNLQLRVHPDDVATASLTVLDPPDEHTVAWTAPGPASIALVPRDYIVIAAADGLAPERRRWQVAAYADATVDVTFVPPHTVRGVEAQPPGPAELTVRAPDDALAVSVSLADGTRLEELGTVVPAIEHSTTIVARVTAPDGRDGPVRRRRVVAGEADQLLLAAPAVSEAAARFAALLELVADDDGLVDVGGDAPVWPAPSSLLAMAWARPTFVPTRALAPLPAAETETIAVINPDSTVTVFPAADVVVADAGLHPFGSSGARRVVADGRQLLVPDIEGRALIVDLTGTSPFVVPAPITRDLDVARRVDLGYRYVAFGRLRPGLELLSCAPDTDDIAQAMIEVATARLAGDATAVEGDALPHLTLAVQSTDPRLATWVIAPHSAITAVSARDPASQ